MGAWGPGLFENDVASDVEDIFNDCVDDGMSVTELRNAVLEAFSVLSSDSDDGPVFWIKYAHLLWSSGILDKKTKEKSFRAIDVTLQTMNDQDDDASALRRELQEMKATLASPMPKKNVKRPRTKKYVNDWNIGDVFTFHIDTGAGKDFYQVFMRKIDECIVYPGHLSPIIYITVSQNSRKREDAREGFLSSRYLQIAHMFGKKQYRCILKPWDKLLNMNDEIQFVGNFANANTPDDEWLFPHKEDTLNYWWGDFRAEIEDSISRFGISKYVPDTIDV